MEDFSNIVYAQEVEEETTTLSETLETTEVVRVEPMSYATILGAILIPSIFVIIAYMVLRYFK